MIIKHITYTKEHKERIKKSYAEYTKPQYLGEDDIIAVRALSQMRALEKIREEEMKVADKTAEEVKEIKLEDLQVGWLHLVNPEDKNHEDITANNEDEFVSLEEKSDYPLWVYTI